MPNLDMTTWIKKDGTRYALALTEKGEVLVLMNRPEKGINHSCKVLAFTRCNKPEDHLMELTRYNDTPVELGLKLTQKGQVALGV